MSGDPKTVGGGVRALLLPGIDNSGPEHWQSRWERSDPSILRVPQRDWRTPVLHEWLEALERAVATHGPGVVLVAHSAGCALVAHWAGRTARGVGGALLVAPADPEAASFPRGAAGFEPMPLNPLPFPSIVVTSSDDPFVTLERAAAFAAAWGSEFLDVGRAGHLNAASGLGDWPEGRELLRRLLVAAGRTADALARKVERFRQLHAAGCFVMPNPWDVGSAALLERLGFPALATTSSGHAWSRARADNRLGLEAMLAHFRELAGRVRVPLNGDFEGGHAVEPEDVATNVARAARTGVAGVSIEDSTGNPAYPLHDLALSVERVRAARRALDADGSGIVLTGRSEGFVVGRADLPETIRRLTAYAEAGADCLYAPGLTTEQEISAVVQAVSPRPVNVLVGSDDSTVARLRDLGVRRISTGGALARAAWTGFLAAARDIAAQGAFGGLRHIVGGAELNALFAGRSRDPGATNTGGEGLTTKPEG